MELERSKISRRITYLRDKMLHLSQPEFARQLGMNGKKGRSTVNNWEQSAVKIKSDDITNIAETFHISADWLLGLSNVSTRDEEIQSISKKTGLSTGAIVKLNDIYKGKDGKDFSAIISALIEDSNAEFFLSLIRSLIEVRKSSDDTILSIPVNGRETSISEEHYLTSIFQTYMIENLTKISTIYDSILEERI